MCNDYGNRIPASEYVEEFSQTRIPVKWAGGSIPNLQARDETWPSEIAPVIRSAGDGVEVQQIRWGLPPARPKAPLVINMRSEGRNCTAGRCLIPASHFFEFTGSKSPKTRWRFTKADAEWFCIAGLCRRGPDGDAFTMLTTDPGPDVAPYHDRQIVVLQRNNWMAWLDASKPAGDLLRPLPAGSLLVSEAPR